MTIAHAGHPAELVIYLAPIIGLWAWLMIARWRDRRRGEAEGEESSVTRARPSSSGDLRQAAAREEPDGVHRQH